MIVQEQLDTAYALRSALSNKRRIINDKIKKIMAQSFSQDNQALKNKLNIARRELDQKLSKLQLIITNHVDFSDEDIDAQLEQITIFCKREFWNKYLSLVEK